METQNFTILYQETNPYSSMTAFLEDDGRTIYLYLQSQNNPEYPMKSVWVKNRVDAPEERAEEDLRSGLAPILCKHEITSSMTTDPILAEEIYFIWIEEGNGLGLFVKDELWAFLPPWSGVDGIHGYSKFAKVEALTAFPLGDSYHGPIAERIEESHTFWENCSKNNSWVTIRESRLSFLESKFGPHSKYWSADGGQFPYIGIARFNPENLDNIAIFATIGLSAQNMPGVELYHKEYKSHSRIELVFAVQYDPQNDTSETWIPHYLGDIVKFPWNMQQWLGHGHTIALNRKDPESIALSFTTILLIDKPDYSIFQEKKVRPFDLSGLPSGNGFDVKFLYMMPLTEEEKFYIVSSSSSNFLAHIKDKGFGWIHFSNRDNLV